MITIIYTKKLTYMAALKKPLEIVSYIQYVTKSTNFSMIFFFNSVFLQKISSQWQFSQHTVYIIKQGYEKFCVFALVISILSIHQLNNYILTDYLHQIKLSLLNLSGTEVAVVGRRGSWAVAVWNPSDLEGSSWVALVLNP